MRHNKQCGVSTMSGGCLTSKQLNTRKKAMIHTANYASASTTRDMKGNSKNKNFHEWFCDGQWWEKHEAAWAFDVDNTRYNLKIIEPCSAQAGLDFDFLMCDDGRVDDHKLNVARDDPIFGDQFTMLAWGNLVFHGSGCANSFGGPVDTGPMSYMFLYLLSEMDLSHSSPGSWKAPGINGYKPYKNSEIKRDMESFYRTMENGPYDDAWLANMNRLDNIAGDYMTAIPLFVKRAIGLCLPVCPPILQKWNLCADYHNAVYGGLKENIGKIPMADGMTTIWANYKTGANILKYDYNGCMLFIEGALRFANAFVVQNDNPSHELAMVGKRRPALTATCDQQYHSRWHWRATGVMRAFLKVTQIARRNGVTKFYGDQNS